ncbi:MAG: GTPase ObgE [Magnetococcales bacterium]|nr:GTPase ObgE [Magnetococcales bacterium]|tara:strand:- start:1052 stop:2185 length:1134 start_codon:yes stop_codon:yes gene_type:complete
MQFLDEAKIFIASGKGGNGCVSFRRERFIPKGGPDGGNGGRGGSVIFVGEKDMNTLIDFRYTQHFKARRGEGGAGKDRFGKAGDDIYIKVPLGTEIIDDETGDMIIDVLEHGQEITMLKGGEGGRGNASFVSSQNRAPRQFTEGGENEEMYVRLRLKLLADVGLLGKPSVGKSTFISKVSEAKPKVADYPFTTLHPNLGMVKFHETDFVLADLPGLIEGASEGHGLGHRFLKHLSRCSSQLHLVDACSETIADDYTVLRSELEKFDKMYGSEISRLPEIVALSRTDALQDDAIAEAKAELEKACNKDVIVLSSHSGEGVEQILTRLVEEVHNLRKVRDKDLLTGGEVLPTEEAIAEEFDPGDPRDYVEDEDSSDWYK